jgi:hypothetical protein
MHLPARRPRRIVSTVLAPGLVTLIVACGAPQPAAAPPAPDPHPPTATVLATSVLHPGDPVPDPEGDTVLTLTGMIGKHNHDSSLRLDAATLDRLGLLEVQVYEPWVKQTMEFQGVWLTDLVALAQVDQAARSLHLTALDDYQIDLTLADVRAGGIFLATRTGEGAPIPVEDGGPTRVVFTAGVRAGSSADQWIWSLSTIDIR